MSQKTAADNFDWVPCMFSRKTTYQAKTNKLVNLQNIEFASCYSAGGNIQAISYKEGSASIITLR